MSCKLSLVCEHDSTSWAPNVKEDSMTPLHFTLLILFSQNKNTHKVNQEMHLTSGSLEAVKLDKIESVPIFKYMHTSSSPFSAPSIQWWVMTRKALRQGPLVVSNCNNHSSSQEMLWTTGGYSRYTGRAKQFLSQFKTQAFQYLVALFLIYLIDGAFHAYKIFTFNTNTATRTVSEIFYEVWWICLRRY